MSLPETEKKLRNRCDSPAPRAALTATLRETVCEGEKPPTPSLSVVSFLAPGLILGCAPLLHADQQSLGDGPTWIGLIIFLAVASLVMHFDVHDIAKQETARESGQSVEQIRTDRQGWPSVFLTSLVVLFLVVAATCSADMPADTRSQGLDLSSVSTRFGTVTTFMPIPLVREQLYARSTKLKRTPDHVENVFGRYLDASLVRGRDFCTRLPEAAGRRAHEEASAVLAATPSNVLRAPRARWSASAQWSDEVTIFFLCTALAIGLATTRADVFAMAQEDHDSVLTLAELQTPSAEKCYKPAKARGQWRLFACIALFLATAASLVASISEGM